MTDHPRNKRSIKNFLINPRFQLKYIFWLGTSGLLLVCINAGIFYYFMHENYTLLVELSPMTEQARQQLYGELKNILIVLGVASLIFLTLISLVGLVISHRAAGPVFHMNRVLTNILNGNPNQRVHLRPNDEFQDLAHNLNKVLDQRPQS